MKECSVYILLAAQLFSFSLVGQSLVDMPPKALKEQALYLASVGDYLMACDYLQAYCTQKPQDTESAYVLAHYYLKSRDYKNAADWFAKAFKANPNKHADALFYEGLMLKQHGAYNQAAQQLTQFMANSAYNKALQPMVERAQIELQGCHMAQNVNQSEAEQSVRIKHLSGNVNQAHIELSPIFYGEDAMLYASFSENEMRVYAHPDSISKKIQFFKAQRDAQDWKATSSLDLPVNDPNFHVGNGVFSHDNRRFYFTKCQNNTQGKYLCTLYLIKRNATGWDAPIKLPESINVKEYTSTQPAIQKADENTDILYFTSNMPGGEGGLDLWKSSIAHQSVAASKPENLGSNINTPSDEMSPYFLEKKQSLYFSSNGWEGYGGLDIFKSTLKGTSWDFAENVGYPLNSSADDLYFTANPLNTEEGFIVSNRTGSIALKHKNCCDDIFSYTLEDEHKIKYSAKLWNTSSIERIIEMEDEDEKQDMLNRETYAMAGERIYLYQYKGNEKPVLLDSTKTSVRGGFSFDLSPNKSYKVVVQREGFFNKHHDINLQLAQDKLLEEKIGMLELTLDPIIIQNIYYPFDDFNLPEESKKRIDSTLYKILIENPDLIVEIASHTDNVGSDKYNDNLSQKRAESVVNYMIEKGIAKKRLYAKGYGERRPIAPNVYSNGMDNPDGRSKNRRTEFRIIGVIKGGNEIIYE